jgi:hypothetical protein
VPPLNTWSFDDTNTWTSDLGYAPLAFTNLSSSLLGDGPALVLDSTNSAVLTYRVVEANSTTNLTVSQGTLMAWFAPASWSSTNLSGTGPRDWGRLIEIGSYTSNASYGWWSLYLDTDGANIYFAAQTNNGSQAVYLSAPVSLDTNAWTHLALTYSATNSALYVDGVLVTNGLPVTLWPGPDVLSHGFCLLSDTNGTSQAHGMLDDLVTYDHPVGAATVLGTYSFESMYYYANPFNFANISPAPSSPAIAPTFSAITGAGNLHYLGTNSSCISSSNVWITNLTASITSTGTVNIKFMAAGGSNGLPYDVFAAGQITSTSVTNWQWAWMGQCYPCVTNLLTITNLPASSAYLILGWPGDPDGDGLSTAYEMLVSHTNPYVPDTSGDGMLDGWKVLWGLNPTVNNTAQPGQRSNFSYLPEDWLNGITGVRGETISLDLESDVQQN